MNIVMKREDLIRELKALLSLAQEYDKRQKARRKEAEDKALREFREELRAALKLSYQEASKKYGGLCNGITIQLQHRPVSKESELESIIFALERDARSLLKINERGKLSEVYRALTFDYDEQGDTVRD